MGDILENCTDRHHRTAMHHLCTELGEFSYDGLVQLEEDLARGKVVRGSWTGCVLSYRRGAPGSARRDCRGRARNPFTERWDTGRLTDEEVSSAVRLELRRRVRAGEPA